MTTNLDDELTRLRSEAKRLRRELTRQAPVLDVLLKRRGFTIYKEEQASDLLVPAKKHLARYYAMLHKYSFRLFLRDVILHKERFTLGDVARYATPAVTKAYLEYLLSIKIIKKQENGYALAKGPMRSFGETLEWYVAEMFKQEFGAEVVWGVKFRRPMVGGDYDVIAKFEDALLYIEVKSSPPKQIYDSEISAFFDRVSDLAPAIAVFFIDTELRMKDKLVPLFEQELQKRSAYPPKVLRMERELFQISDRIFIVNAKESVIQNMQKVISWYYRHARAPF